MATYTSNLNLYMPDPTDDFGEFREEHNDNMVKIDNAIGGGGGSGGHTIVNPSGTDMPAEGKLQFTGGVTVTDDSVNGKTVVDISGGGSGGNVYGAFIDTNRLITSGTYTGTLSYTATEDCFVVVDIATDSNTDTHIEIDGVAVNGIFRTSGNTTDVTFLVPLKKGQTLSVVNGNAWSCSYHAYGLTQGTNGIFTPIIYSDTERVVGVWRDNKPLYQRTFVFETPVAVSYSAFTDTTIDSTDIENIVDNHATHADGTNYGSLIADPTRQTHTKVGLQTNRNGNNANVKTLTIRYTKISDVAGSGNWNTDGVPTVHYSTTEQVIGTWENGKPLYARLINPNITANATASGDIKYGSFALSNFIADVDMAWIDTGMSYYEVSGATRGFMSAWYQKDNGLITITTLFERNNVPATIAIKYTKSTD